MLSYRQMEVTDLNDVCSIEQEANGHPWSREQILTGLEPRAGFEARAGKEVLLACLSNNEETTVIAFAIYGWVLDEVSLLNLCVASEHQGQGVGKALLEQLLALAIKAKKIKCFLEVRRSNFKAIGLYESSGFKKNCVRKNYYPTLSGEEGNEREDAVLYYWERQ